MKPEMPFMAGESLSDRHFSHVRLRTIFECCKYDPQVGDTSVLAPFPLLLGKQEWSQLARWAEELARETLAAESEILERPDLLKDLGLPRVIWKILTESNRSTAGPRAMRFDFHYTLEGWRISEVNSDVPGGWIEADGFTQRMAEACGLEPVGLPGRSLAQALAGMAALMKPTVGLVHATAYSDDRQVALFLAQELEKLGGRPILAAPNQITWQEGRCFIKTDWFKGEAQALFRFFPAEWLPNLKRSCAWPRYFAGARTPQSNPGWALVSQSKRFGMVLPRLKSAKRAWSQLLPETREVRGLEFGSPDWVWKPALGRVGESVGLHGATDRKEWRQIRQSAFLFPHRWVAQRAFRILPITTPVGPRYSCLGVYTIDGRAAGIYGRVSACPIINQTAQDAAVLLSPN